MEVFNYPDRTEKQHNTEWLYYQIISNITGHTPYEIYENMAMRILKTICEDGTIGYVKPASLNTYHHNLYMEQVRMIAGGFDILLPEPTTDITLHYRVKKLGRNARKK